MTHAVEQTMLVSLDPRFIEWAERHKMHPHNRGTRFLGLINRTFLCGNHPEVPSILPTYFCFGKQNPKSAPRKRERNFVSATRVRLQVILGIISVYAFTFL